jgi:hypothetical protein
MDGLTAGSGELRPADTWTRETGGPSLGYASRYPLFPEHHVGLKHSEQLGVEQMYPPSRYPEVSPKLRECKRDPRTRRFRS